MNETYTTDELLERIRMTRKMEPKSDVQRIVSKEMKNRKEYEELPEWVKELSPTKNVQALKTLMQINAVKNAPYWKE